MVILGWYRSYGNSSDPGSDFFVIFMITGQWLKEKLEQARPYTVSLYQWQLDRLTAEQALVPLQGGALGLGGHYNEQTGFFYG